MMHLARHRIWGARAGTPPFGRDRSRSAQTDGPVSQDTIDDGDGDGEVVDDDNTAFEPSILDVLVTRAILAKAFLLPAEIINKVIDYAEYWPHTTASIEWPDTLHVRGGRNEDTLVLRTRPVGFVPSRITRDYSGFSLADPKALPHTKDVPIEKFHAHINSPVHTVSHPARKIVFTTSSHDQGWSAEPRPPNPYEHSWTWFEAGLERFEDSDDSGKPLNLKTADNLHTVQPPVTLDEHGDGHFEHEVHPRPAYTIQQNRLADREFHRHVVEWRHDDDGTTSPTDLQYAGRGTETADGSFVRGLRLGDVVTVWAKARFPQWTNHVESVRVDVYWFV